MRRQELFNRGILIQDLDFDFVDFVVFFQCMRSQVLHLLVNIYKRHALANILLHLHEEVPVHLHELLHILRVLTHALGTVLLVLYLALHRFLVFGELLLYVEEEILEELRVIHDELVNNGTMHVDARELVRVAVDYAGHSSKVIRNLLRVRVDNKVIITGDVLQEVAIVGVVAGQRCKFNQVLSVVGLLFPEVEFVVRQNPQLLTKTLNCINDLLDENLQD